ncbi:LytR/AlgR family response regulator transcription factor [Sunxiuqinia elliptica]|uniref:LytTR family two component transcriptional regulator n=1 Tax=Sunxiuqinia elliptica TaxID=655355 RepID=A0A4R6GMP6_9BACT|nr:LytTR family DNA-binding domain-containing protein [Sunxiuqinia elliptica]TDN96237.1 LytTR family two component transcriptional regulator [Sunxiuqinia elliptica]TDO67948.1 LytTR family two component transcriptional regulator [Sunxiuqinia elliptica]
MTNKKLTALIVDDEKEARDLLRYMLKEHKEIAIVDEADNTESALFKFLELRPDIVFLDLIMPGKNGMEFISLVKKQKLNTNIVIVSAYRDMAIEAIRNEVYDFILKPIGPRKLNKAIEAIIKRKEEHVSTELNAIFDQYKQETKLRISSNNSHTLIDPKEIVYCEAQGSYTHIHMDNGEIELSSNNIGRISEILSEYRFFRIGRSILINLDKLWRANRSDYSCILIAGKKEVKLYGSKKQIRELCKIEINK